MTKITSRLTEQIEQILKDELGHANLTKAAAERLIGKEDRLRRDVRKAFLKHSIDDGDTLSQETARRIMGRNFLGIAEVTEHLRRAKPAELRALAEIPFSEERLRACARTHLLVADIGLASSNLYLKSGGRKHDRLGGFVPHHQNSESPQWRLISKAPLEDSYSKTWDEQCDLARQHGAQVPSARQLTYAALLHWRAHGEWPITGRGRVSDEGYRDDEHYLVDAHASGMDFYERSRHLCAEGIGVYTTYM